MAESLQLAATARQVSSTNLGRADRSRTILGVLVDGSLRRKVVAHAHLNLPEQAPWVLHGAAHNLVPRACDFAGYEARDNTIARQHGHLADVTSRLSNTVSGACGDAIRTCLAAAVSVCATQGQS